MRAKHVSIVNCILYFCYFEPEKSNTFRTMIRQIDGYLIYQFNFLTYPAGFSCLSHNVDFITIQADFEEGSLGIQIWPIIDRMNEIFLEDNSEYSRRHCLSYLAMPDALLNVQFKLVNYNPFDLTIHCKSRQCKFFMLSVF